MALKGSTGASGVAGAEVLIPVPLPPGHGFTIARCFSTVNSRALKLTFLSQARHISCNFIPLPSPEQKIPSSRHVRMDGIAVQDRTGSSQWNRLSWMALTARSASSRSMMQEILISLVEIIWMLMLLLASASNMLAATPLWLCMPAPTMDTLA